MLDVAAEKISIRLDWRRERAYRVGLTIAKFGAGLSLLATFVNFTFSRPIVVGADILLFFGCLVTCFTSLRGNTNNSARHLVWQPFYFSYWIAISTTLYVTGGVQSPFIGVFLSLLFVGGVVIQSAIKAIWVLTFVIANFLFWLGAEYFLPTMGPAVQPAIYCFLLNAICLCAIGICIFGFLKTEQDLAEEFSHRYLELEQAKTDLSREETANASKSLFLANISHEFRTPLSVMLGYVELLQTMNSNNIEGQEFLSIVQRNGRHLVHLVDDLLDLSKAEADRLEIDLHECNLVELLHQIHDSMGIVAEKKNLRLKVRFLSPIAAQVITDSARLKQILLNLIGNAIKFTEQGDVILEVSLDEFKGTEKTLGLLKIDIVDTGRGLSAEEKEKLFKPFSQADATMARKYGGTGLGLNLSKRLAELLGGSLMLGESEVGVGSRFKLSVAVEILEHAARISNFQMEPVSLETEVRNDPKVQTSAKPSPKLRLSGLKILVVDDLVDNRVLVQRYIQSAGGEVDFAVDGREGIDKALGGKFDLVLMDIQMPGMSGIEATMKLREQNYHKPILALSAHAMKHEKSKSLDAGFNDHLTKPIQRETLIHRIEAVLKKEVLS